MDTNGGGERGLGRVGWREITESDFEGAAMPTNLIDILLTTPAMFKFDSL